MSALLLTGYIILVLGGLWMLFVIFQTSVVWGILSILTLLAGVFLWTGHLWSQLLLGAAAMLQSCMLILLFRPDYPAHLRQISQSAKWTLAMGLVAVISL